MSRANFVQVQLAQAATDIQTTLSVKAPTGGFKLPPADGGRLVLTDSLGQPLAFEVITYTGRTGSGPYTLTGVVRGVEGTVGLAWGVDTFVLQALTAGDLQELMDSKLGVGATAVAATKLADARTINGVAFDGSADITVADATKEPAIPAGTTAQYWRGNKTWRDFATDVRAAVLTGLSTANNSAIAAADTLLAAMGKLQAQITGLATSKLDATANAVSASKLQTARTIGGVAFDGTANINLPGVNAAGNQNTSGNAATATKLANARTISVSGAAEGFASFDGSSNVEVVTKTPRVSPATDPTSNFRADVFGGVDDKVKVLRPGGTDFLNFPRYSPCLVWSTSDTHAFFSPTYNSPRIRVGAGSGAGITWEKDLAFTDSNITGNAATATKLQTARTIGGVSFDGTANINLPGVNAAGNQSTSGNAATATKLATARTINGTSFSGEANIVTTTWGTARTLTIGNTGKSVDGSGNISWTLAEIGAVTSSVDTTPGRLLTTDYLDIGKLDKTLWPKATSLLTLKNGPDRTVWVETDTVDAPHSGFYGSVSSKRLSSTTVIFEAKSLFEAARYTYTFTPLGDSGWVKETMHEVGDWVDLRPNLLAPYFWKSARDGSNHFPQIRLVDRNTVELRGIVSYNASSAAPPNGVAFRVPEGFRPQMTSAGICFADSSSPLWFGQTAYLIQGQVNYSSDPGWANGNVRLLLLSAPNPVADGAVDLSGIRYYLS